jgi:hypothetical protein
VTRSVYFGGGEENERERERGLRLAD